MVYNGSFDSSYVGNQITEQLKLKTANQNFWLAVGLSNSQIIDHSGNFWGHDSHKTECQTTDLVEIFPILKLNDQIWGKKWA